MRNLREGLKRNADTYEKYSMTEEKKTFLNALQQEMNTQDHLSQADPRFWVIRDYHKIYGKDIDDADGICILDGEDNDVICEVEYDAFDKEGFVESIVAKLVEYGIDPAELTGVNACSSFDSIEEELSDLDIDNYIIVKEFTKIPVENGFFLTHEAAIKHLEENYYHYSSDVHTFAKTAWRSKEEPLWDILHSVDFTK